MPVNDCLSARPLHDPPRRAGCPSSVCPSSVCHLAGRNALRSPDWKVFLSVLLAVLVVLLVLLPAESIQASGFIWPTTPSAANAAGHWPTLAEIDCGAYVVMNRTTGQVLLSREPDKAMYPASTTKVLTALLALERLAPNQVLTLSAQAVNLTANASRVGYKAGERVYVRDLLAGMMLASGNDAANAVGEAISGSGEAFAAVMNERARQLGAQHSNFVNPSGIHSDLHVSTARDLALITAGAMKNPDFRSLVALESASMPATNLHPLNGWAIFYNTNRMMAFDETYLSSSEIRAVTGVKTGSTNQAGDNLIAAATTTSGVELVAVLMKAPLSTADSNKFVSMRTLLEEGARRARQGGTPAATTQTGSATSAAGSSGSSGTASSAATGTATGTAAAGTSGSSSTATGMVASSANLSSGPATAVTQTGSSLPGGGAIGDFGLFEGLRQSLDISPAAFLTISVLLGLLLGLAIGLTLVWILFRTTHRHRQAASRSRRN